MFVTTILLALSGLSLGFHSQVPQLDGRIVGGTPVDIEKFPYQVSLHYLGSHVCGASIISPKYVVTAGHCTFGRIAFSMQVRAGSSLKGSGGELVGVDEFVRHPQYNQRNSDYDIAILILSRELTLGSSIPLPNDNDEFAPGSKATASGWGALSEGGSSPERLQAVDIAIVSRKECNSVYNITDRMICAGVLEGGKDSCQGDSGGPLLCNGVLAGIVSWGNGCARPGYPGVYASVPNLRGFIRRVTGI
ncbi:hypothetical protein ILUMI_09876 [Ignelater luminosus]|uniref:Peptidase S1 domain-containing protein n=1 Tax=Ignelater luminosus TaxID=2038154 RepID=A0A8K0D4B1_IGNLU|nr:hypothetical protein ILUMI_09876 [Ignelater luminosus]